MFFPLVLSLDRWLDVLPPANQNSKLNANEADRILFEIFKCASPILTSSGTALTNLGRQRRSYLANSIADCKQNFSLHR